MKHLTNSDHFTAQEELDDKMFAHYLLGRQLAMEQVLKAMLDQFPEKKRQAIREAVAIDTNLAMERTMEDEIQDDKQYVSDCGFVHAMLQAGF